MNNRKDANPLVIVYADDDPEDRMLAQEAFEENNFANQVVYVEDGEELISYLKNEGKYHDKQAYPSPSLILLDLNMPKMDGREALEAIKTDSKLRLIPVVILTTSSAEEDIIRSYDLGVSSFITKPVTFKSLVETISTISKYWFELVKLPTQQ